jgi:hypothetical protein
MTANPGTRSSADDAQGRWARLTARWCRDRGQSQAST